MIVEAYLGCERDAGSNPPPPLASAGYDGQTSTYPDSPESNREAAKSSGMVVTREVMAFCRSESCRPSRSIFNRFMLVVAQLAERQNVDLQVEGPTPSYHRRPLVPSHDGRMAYPAFRMTKTSRPCYAPGSTGRRMAHRSFSPSKLDRRQGQRRKVFAGG